jgi:hypothetical protein
MNKYLIIISLLLFSLKGMTQDDCQFYDRYIGKGDSIMMERNNPDFKKAIEAYSTAMLDCPEKASLARKKILDVYLKIDTLKRNADSLKVLAISKTTEANREKEKALRLKSEAENEKRRAEAARERFNLYSLANAPYKYIRLIREGPKDDSKIKRDSFDLELIAYCRHLDTIRYILDTTSVNRFIDALIPDAFNEYKNLRENLYYNNDLYEKTYFCLESLGSKSKELIFNENGDGWKRKVSELRFPRFNKDSSGISLANGKDIFYKNSDEPNDGEFDPKNITAITYSDSMSQIFVATEDHYIIAYKIEEDSIDRPAYSIAMGTMVTALDVDSRKKALFFGTKDGDIGFIENYGNNVKFQPVYSSEKFLEGSRITSIDIFNKKDGDGFETRELDFMLVSGHNSKAVVYKLDSNFIQPGHKFSGNILPENDLGKIEFSAFDSSANQIFLEVTNRNNGIGYYKWDPFTMSALEKYKKSYEEQKGTVPHTIMEATNFYNKSK